MTQKQLIDQFCEFRGKCTTDDVVALNFAYEMLAPRWISVEEELPKIDWTMSDTVVVTDGNGGLRLAWYHQDEGWHFATGLPFEPTHWMSLPESPVVSNLEKIGKDLKGGEQ